MSIEERVRAVHERGLVSNRDFQALSSGNHTLDVGAADKMIENVIGVMGLPIGLGLNFMINDKDYVVPLVVEEPSIVAALSAAAKLARGSGGFTTSSTDPVLIGQIQVMGVTQSLSAKDAVLAARQEIVNLANSFHPKMVARGGGAKDIEVFLHRLPSSDEEMLVVHLLVDTRDAMGANIVNGMCEGVASLIESLTRGKVFLRILSNLTDRAMAVAEVSIPCNALEGKGSSGEEVRDGVIIAADFAHVDPYRAATHNKGIMNGIDAVALATGNDWRAIEAGAHAYAARKGVYSSMTEWWKDPDGNLRGRLALPLKVGTVGGPLQSNPTVALNLRLLGVESATELAEVMAAVGLAQNFAALRALVTEGIQKGHMTLHARSVLTAAGTPPEVFDDALERLLLSGEIKVWKAKQLVEEINSERDASPGHQARPIEDARLGVGYGKVILLGEHAVVYGRHAIAAPVPIAVRAHVEDCDEDVNLVIPKWGIEYKMSKRPEHRRSFEKPAGVMLDQLGLSGRAMRIEVFPDVPRGVGLGGSAALAVAIVRALNVHFGLGLSDDEVNQLAFESEKVAHGNPSGLDNTVATYAQPLVYRSGTPPLIEPLNIQTPLSIVIGMTGIEGLTATTVRRVRDAWKNNRRLYDGIFDEIDSLSLQGVAAIQDHDLDRLGELMNVCQGLLNALQVSSPELETLIALARDAGAKGAKLTGGGGGGSMIALCDGNAADVVHALTGAGHEAIEVSLGLVLDGQA